MTIVAVPAIRDLGTVPNNNMDESTFNSASESFTSNIPPWGGDLKAVADSAKTNAEHSHAKAGESAASAQTAADRLADVNSAASGAFAAANYKGEWSGLAGALNLPATVTHQGRLWYLKSNLANVATQAPALGSIYWGEVGRNDFTVLPCPAGTTIAADRGMYRMSSGSSVLQLPASPFHGMVVAAVNVSGTLSPVIQRNGKTICGDAEDYVMNVLGWQIMLQFDSASNDWVSINGVTAYTAAQPAIASANTWTAPQNFAGGVYIQGGGIFAGAKSSAFEFAHFTFTAPSAASGTITIPHGLDWAKIIRVSVAVQMTAAPQLIFAESILGMDVATRNNNYWVGYSVDNTGVTIHVGANSVYALGKSGRVVIEYLI